MDNGSIQNSAVANGLDLAGGAVASNTSAATVTATRSPALTVRKTASPATVSTAGQAIAYSFVVTNTGNVTVHGIAIGDVLTAPAGPTPTITCPTTTLAPNASTTCTATYSTTQSDIDHGSVTNTATASGLSPNNAPVTSPPSTASVTAQSGASLSLVKTAAPTVVSAAGQPVTYSFKVTNTGNVTVNGLSIADTFTAPAGPVPTVTCPATALAPERHDHVYGDLQRQPGRHRQRHDQELRDRQRHRRPGQPGRLARSPTPRWPSRATPRLALTKTASPTTITAAGQRITYTFTVTNPGNVTISNVSIADTFTSPAGPVPAITCPATTLAPGTSTNCTATYTATQADVDNGTIKNSAVAQGNDPGGNNVTSPTATATVTAPAAAALTPGQDSDTHHGHRVGPAWSATSSS